MASSATPRGKRVRLGFGDMVLRGRDELMFLSYVLDADNGRFLVVRSDSSPRTGDMFDIPRPTLLELGYEPR